MAWKKLIKLKIREHFLVRATKWFDEYAELSGLPEDSVGYAFGQLYYSLYQLNKSLADAFVV